MPTQQFENILLSASNAPLYYAFKNRKNTKSTPVVAIEDKNAVDYNLKTKPTGEEFENSLKAYDEYFERLPENQKKNLEKDENVSHFLKNLAALLLDAEFGQISSMVEFHQRLKNMGSVPPLVTHGPAFKGLISTAEKSVKAAIARDTASAHRLTQIKKSGVYFVGQEHLKNISTYLEKNCTEEVKMQFVGDAYHSVESHVFDSAQ